MPGASGAVAPPPSGEQIVIRNGSGEASITEVGGGLRTFQVDGVPVLFSYGLEQMCSGGRGQVLAPWPNRLEDGTYDFDGLSATAALDEPEHHNAIHGLVRWLGWHASAVSRSAVTMSVVLSPQPAYPWRLRLEVRYELVLPGRLEVVATAENRSPRRAPFGIGFHPYLHPGAPSVDTCELAFRASERIVSDERGLPVGAEPVAGTEHDFSSGRRLGGRRLDDCYRGLEVGDDGTWTASLRRGDGRLVVLRGGREFGHLMCFTADTLVADDRRHGLALEPMSCPPNALRSGTDLVLLAPAGETGSDWSGRWSLELAG